MSATAKTLKLPTPHSKQSFEVNKEIRNRRSQELVIALCGAVGSGIKELNDKLQTELENHGYHVEHIKLSSLIIGRTGEETKNLSNFDRYKKLQDLGDQLRQEYSSDIIAQLAIEAISTVRMAEFGESHPIDQPLKVFEKVAYIVDQVKHPSEIELFREVYRNNFYLIGLLRTENERKNNLKEEQIQEPNISELIERDRKASQKHGQHVEASFHKSDYFIRNIGDTRQLTNSVQRFIALIHGTHPITPTKDEVGIYAAYSASLKSACLSRQVGASITDDSGLVVATGCNDVPKFGGGLYDESSTKDGRCFNHGQECYNDKHKSILKDQIGTILRNHNIANPINIAEEIIQDTKAKSLIEYSRAIHAEMDAIIALARTNLDTINKTLYCTTYPCHICARHIVASGIKRVVYVEPYEKSLAILLHGDAIHQSEESSGREDKKVSFEMFEGVSPRRYSRFFSINRPRKDSGGKAIEYKIKDSGHVDPQHLDSYVDYESKVIQNLKEHFPDPKAS
ncbi:MAG: hypothetical protein KGZ39_04965 [Simkania sp.]|nr:hypothetical protein [Simkania sp.]